MAADTTREELQKECLTQVALIKYGTTPSNLSGEQLAQIAFASADWYQFIQSEITKAQEQLLDELEQAVRRDPSTVGVIKHIEAKRKELKGGN